MSSVATALRADPRDPARVRGLKRRRQFAPIDAVTPTALPPPVDPLQLLALLTRHRQALVAVGELAARAVYDVRAFKTAYAELGYLRRLAHAGRAGGTVVTSMVQLVAGLAEMHPAWNMTGDRFENRDRHHQAVRRRLRSLEAIGVIRCRVGVDDDGNERRTEIELLPVPPINSEELSVAAGRLSRWQKRYGAALNTGSSTGVRNAAGHGRPLPAEECQRRGRTQTRAAVRRRRGDRSHTETAPPSGASAPPQKNQKAQTNRITINVGERTGARVTRTNASDHLTAKAAHKPPTTSTSAFEERGSGGPGGRSGGGGWEAAEGRSAGAGESAEAWLDPEAVARRLQARAASQAEVLAGLARAAERRAVQLAGWTLEREWSYSRIREAWVVARYGATAAAECGPAGAGPLYPADYERLRRAARRYERYAGRWPAWPQTGLAALLRIGADAGEKPNGALTLRWAIGGLDQLSKRMRAAATEASPERLDAAADRARRRHQPLPAGALSFAFRARDARLGAPTPRWPAWVVCDPDGAPVFDRGGLLQVDTGHPACPPEGTAAWQLTVRDAYLAAGIRPPASVDGRSAMAARSRGQLDRPPRPQVRTVADWELAELARLTGTPAAQLARLDPAYRSSWLAETRRRRAAAARAEIRRLADRLTDPTASTELNPEGRK